MTKFVTRTTKSTKALIMVCDTANEGAVSQKAYETPYLKDEKAILKAVRSMLNPGEVAVKLLATEDVLTLRRMSEADFIAHSTVVNK